MFNQSITPITVNEIHQAVEQVYDSFYTCRIFPSGDSPLVAWLGHIGGDYTAPWNLFILREDGRLYVSDRTDHRENTHLTDLLSEIARRRREATDIPFTRVLQEVA